MRVVMIAILCLAPAICMAVSSSTAMAQAVEKALAIKPDQPGFDYDQPDAAAQKGYKVESASEKFGTPGFVVYDNTKQILRLFLDRNKDKKLDQWSFYKDGIEVYRDIDSDFDGEIDEFHLRGSAGMQKGVIDDEWPPKNPDPSKILRDARKDTRKGEFETALAKYVWCHENALAIDPSGSASWRSSGLSHWLELGERYPPALEKMRDIRDLTELEILDPDRVRVKFESFQYFVALNRTLREEEKTVELFKWLCEDDPVDAPRVYPVAQPALIKHEEFEICGQFIDLEEDVASIGRIYAIGSGMGGKFGEQRKQFSERALVKEAAILVGILVKTDRADEAQTASEALKKLVTDESLATKLEKALGSALEGKIPAP